MEYQSERSLKNNPKSLINDEILSTVSTQEAYDSEKPREYGPLFNFNSYITTHQSADIYLEKMADDETSEETRSESANVNQIDYIFEKYPQVEYEIE